MARWGARLGRYWRVWRAFAKSCLEREAQFRASLAAGLLRSVVWLALGLINIEILFSYTDAIAGWSRGQMWLLLGIARLGESALSFAFRGNMERISSYITYGDMDFILLKPISSQFAATLRFIDIYQAPQMLINLGLIGYAFRLMGRWPSAGGLATFAVMFPCGIAMLYALWTAVSTCTFWLVRQAPNIVEILDSLYGAARYPTRVFPEFLQFILTFLVPLAFVTVLPAQALALGINPLYPLGSLAFAAASLYLSHRFWTFATRYYTSASS